MRRAEGGRLGSGKDNSLSWLCPLHQVLMRLPSSLSSSRAITTLSYQSSQGSGGAKPRLPFARIRALCPALALGLAHWKVLYQGTRVQ